MNMNKVKCEVCTGIGLMYDAGAAVWDEQCTSCNGKGHFDDPEDSIDHWVEAANYVGLNWRDVSQEIIKFKEPQQ